MWGAITELCKVFAEKHLIPSVISFTCAIAILLYLPNDYWMITKIGKFLFFILVSGLIFLAMQLIVFCYKKIVECNYGHKQKERYIHSALKNEKNDMEGLWTVVDKFNPDDRYLINEFLENGNAPIERSSGSRYFGNSLLASDWVVSTEEYGEEEQPVIISEHLKGKAMPLFPIGIGRAIVVKYKLRDDIFSFLKYSKEKYGKISHFE